MDNQIRSRNNQEDTGDKTSGRIPPLRSRIGFQVIFWIISKAPETKDGKGENSKKYTEDTCIEFEVSEGLKKFFECIRWYASKPNLAEWLMVVVTAGLTITSILQWRAVYNQLGIMKISSEAARTAAETGNRQLELSERPWIGIPGTVQSVQDMGIGRLEAPLTKITESVNISFTFKNYGHSPAIGVGYQLLLVVGGPKEHQFRDHHVCEDATGNASRNHAEGFKFGITVFPSEVSPPQFYLTGTGPINRADDAAWLVGCIAYSGEPNKQIYYTRLFYRVNRQNNSVVENGVKYYPITGFDPFYVDTDWSQSNNPYGHQ